VTRRGWLLFAAMSVIWGIPYLLIKIAVRDLEPATIVAGRTFLAALVLVPLAAGRGAIRPVLRRWKPLLAFTVLEMAIPWLLLTNAEKRLPSGLTGLLVATVPLLATVVAFLLGDRTVLRPLRLAGLTVGIVGVGVLVGLGGGGGSLDTWSVLQVILVAVGYATAPFIVTRLLADVPAIGVIALSLAAVAIAFTPLAIADRPASTPPWGAVWSVVALAVICTGLAFILFFELLDEVGPTTAPLITFVNPAVALTLGVILLDEVLTAGLVLGFPLVLAGCWLATRTRAPARAPVEPIAATAQG
jgi:drug/metabolite transporter (DMT)-like permease